MRKIIHRIGTWKLALGCLLLASGHLRADFPGVELQLGPGGGGSPLAASSQMRIVSSAAWEMGVRSHDMPLASEVGKFQRNLWLFMGLPCAITIIILLGMLSQEQGGLPGQGPGAVDVKKPPGQAPPDAQHPVAEAPRLVSPGSVNLRMCLRGRDERGGILEVSFGSNDFAREGGTLVVGRSRKRSHLALPHDSISRQHISLTLQGESLVVRDLNSANGTSVNGTRLTNNPSGVPLWPGDRIRIGEIDCIYERG